MSDQQPPPRPWSMRFDDKMEEFRKMPEDWDSYGAHPLTAESMGGATGVFWALDWNGIKEPDCLVPTQDGGVMVEWMNIDGWDDVLLEIDGNGHAEIWYGAGTPEDTPCNEMLEVFTALTELRKRGLSEL